MPLRKRISLVAAAAVAIAVLLAVIVCYYVVRGQLRGEVDNELRAQAIAVQHGSGLERPLPGLAASAGGPAPYAQVVLANGSTFPEQGSVALPTDARARAVAAGGGAAYLTDVSVGGSHLR